MGTGCLVEKVAGLSRLAATTVASLNNGHRDLFREPIRDENNGDTRLKRPAHDKQGFSYNGTAPTQGFYVT
jgi:hypothetical protein